MRKGLSNNKNEDTAKTSKTSEKGVNITSEELHTTDQISRRAAEDFPSISNVEEQIRNAIDSLSVGTPHMCTSSIGDADNEESVISSTSIYTRSSVFQVKHFNQVIEGTSVNNTPRDVSEISNRVECCKTTPYQVQDFQQTNQPIYIPALLPPAVLCMNPSCKCAHSVGCMQRIPVASSQHHNNNINNSSSNNNNNAPLNKVNSVQCSEKCKLANIIQKFTQPKQPAGPLQKNELYKINIKKTKEEGELPKRFVFDLVKDPPKARTSTIGTNTRFQNGCKHSRANKSLCKCFLQGGEVGQNLCKHQADGILIEPNLVGPPDLDCKLENNYCQCSKVDVYYFDHGNASYYKTTDSPPLIHTELVAEKAENYAAIFWAEIFGMVYIAFAFVTSFILQFSRFILHSVIRPLTIGVLQQLADYFFKPLLATIFNAVVQPILIFIYNIATSIRDLCAPVAEGFGYFVKEVAVCCRAIRLFEIRQDRRVFNNSDSDYIKKSKRQVHNKNDREAFDAETCGYNW